MLDEFSFIRLFVKREIIDFVMLVFIWEDVINRAKVAEKINGFKKEFDGSNWLKMLFIMLFLLFLVEFF